jgi:hypothetical protein
MTPVINEGDVFTRAKLLKSLRRMSALNRAIYPLQLRDVVVRLDRTDRLIDVTICFRQLAKHYGQEYGQTGGHSDIDRRLSTS